MILVLASVGDDAARSFVEEDLAGGLGTLCTCLNLAAEPIALRFPAFEASALNLVGRRVGVGEISGVVNLLPAVLPETLVAYDVEEREYQAAEFHALLTFFLSNLACRVVNRPTPLSLTAPVLNPLGWFYLADAAGIPLTRICVESALDETPGTEEGEKPIEVVFLGGRIIAASGTVADTYAAVLAKRCRLEYLKTEFDHVDRKDIRFARAQTIPDIRDAAVRSALRAYLGAPPP